jgi:hypothetical protein
MWYDWQYTPPATAKTYLAALQASQLPGGDLTMIRLANETTENNPRTPRLRETSQEQQIRDLQLYLYKIEHCGWDWACSIDPRRLKTMRVHTRHGHGIVIGDQQGY